MINSSSHISRNIYILQLDSHTCRRQYYSCDYNTLKYYRSLSQKGFKLFFLQFEFMYLEETHARMQIWLWSTSLWAMFRSKKDVPFRWHHCEVPHSAYHRWGTAMAIAPTSSSFHLCFLILIARVASADILQLCCYCCFSDSEFGARAHIRAFL